MVTYESDGVATLTIDDPERRNPLALQPIEGLIDGMERRSAIPSVSVIVITGAGDAAFSAGGDLSSGFFDDPVANHAERGRFADLLRLLWRGGKPTVARVNGHAWRADSVWPWRATSPSASTTPSWGCPRSGRAVADDDHGGAAPGDAAEGGAGADADRAGPSPRTRRCDWARCPGWSPGSSTARWPRRSMRCATPRPPCCSAGRLHVRASTDPDTALDRLQAGLTAVVGTADAREGVAAFIEKRQARFVGT
jgi:hypothetical protein